MHIVAVMTEHYLIATAWASVEHPPVLSIPLKFLIDSFVKYSHYTHVDFKCISKYPSKVLAIWNLYNRGELRKLAHDKYVRDNSRRSLS